MRRAAVASAVVMLATASWAATRLGELVSVRGLREHQLVGMGLVVGLKGTADRSVATREAVRRFAASCGLELPEGAVDNPPCTLVALAAELPAFASEGSRLDVTVAACVEATDLAGGVLLCAPLWAGRKENVYARAQGVISVADGVQGACVGTVRGGGIVERDLPPELTEEFINDIAKGVVRLLVRRPSLTVASAIAKALARTGAAVQVRAISPGELELELGVRTQVEALSTLASLLELEVDCDKPQIASEGSASGGWLSGAAVSGALHIKAECLTAQDGEGLANR